MVPKTWPALSTRRAASVPRLPSSHGNGASAADRRRVQGAKRFRRSSDLNGCGRLWDMGVTSSSAISPPRALGNGNGSRPLAQIVDVFFNLSDFPAVEDSRE